MNHHQPEDSINSRILQDY